MYHFLLGPYGRKIKFATICSVNSQGTQFRQVGNILLNLMVVGHYKIFCQFWINILNIQHFPMVILV